MIVDISNYILLFLTSFLFILLILCTNHLFDAYDKINEYQMKYTECSIRNSTLGFALGVIK